MLSEGKIKLVAHLLCTTVDKLDPELLKEAAKAGTCDSDRESKASRLLWDAFANCGQMVDNVVGPASRTAIVYSYLQQG